MSGHGPAWRLLRPHARHLALAALLSALAALAAVALLAVSLALLTWAADRPPVLHLLVLVVAVRALALVRAGARYGERLEGHDGALGVVDGARRWVWRAVSRRPHALVGRRAGDVLHAVVSDLDQVQQLLVAAVVPIAGLVLALVAVGATATTLVPAAGAILVLGLLVGGAGSVLVTRHVSRSAAELVRRRAASTTTLVDDLEDAEELRDLGFVDRRIERHTTAAAALARLEARAGTLRAVATGFVPATAGATLAGVLAAAASAGADPRIVAALAGCVLGGFEVLAPLPQVVQRALEASTSLGRLSVLDQGPLPASPDSAPQGALLHLVGVRVGAPDAPRLDVDRLEVCPGDRVAVVGPTGSGKTTLAHVLSGLLPVDSGRVTTDGGREARDVVGLVPQSPHLFAGTVGDNLRIAAPGASDADLGTALRRVGLGDWLAANDGGLDTLLGEAGRGLSSGQGRRLATARVLLADRAVLILDEPTADLDPTTAVGVLEDLVDAAGDRAIVLITHDPVALEVLRRRSPRTCEVSVTDGRLLGPARSGLAMHPGRPGLITG